MNPNTENIEVVATLLFGTRWQTDLADLMDVEPRTVRRWASGANIPGRAWTELLDHLRARRSDIDRTLMQMSKTRISRMTLDFNQTMLFKRAISHGIQHLQSGITVKTPSPLPATDDPGNPAENVSFAERAMQAPLLDTLNRLAIVSRDIDRCRGERATHGSIIMTLIPDDEVDDNDSIVVEFDATETGPIMLLTLCMDASIATGDREAAKLVRKLLEC